MKSYSSFVWLLVVTLSALVIPILFVQQDEKTIQIQTLQTLKNYLSHDINITIPIEVRFGDDGFIFPDLVKASQIQIDYHLADKLKNQSNLHIKLIDRTKTHINESIDTNKYVVELIHSNENSIALDSDFHKVYLFYTLQAVHANDLPFYITQSVLYHLLSLDIELFSKGFDSPFNYHYDTLINIISIGNGTELSNIRNTTALELENFINQTKHYTRTTLSYYSLKPSDKLPAHFKCPSNINLFYTDIPSILKIHNHTVFQIENNSTQITNLKPCNEELDLQSPLSQIEKSLGLPKHPDNNLSLKLLAMARYNTIHGLISTADLLIQLLNRPDKIVTAQVTEFYGIIDLLESHDDINIWYNLLYRTSMVHGLMWCMAS